MELDLRPFEDGGWYWFDLTTDGGELSRSSKAAGTPTRRRPGPGRRHHRHAHVQPARRLRRHPHRDRRGPAGAGRASTAVILPDQGTKKVRDEPGFEAAAARARRQAAHHRPAQPRRLRRLRPRHVRGARATDCEQILLHGRRHPAGARLGAARRRVLPLLPRADAGRRADAVAAGALAAVDDGRGRRPQRLPVAQRPGHRAAPRPRRAPAAADPVAAPAHRRRLQRLVDVPDPARRSPRTSGLPLPLFIKWDDAEYGLRARSRGYRTATVPGIAIWHMSFLEKDDTSDWQAYFHYRNRYVAAALHGPDNPRALLRRHVQAHPAAPDAHGVLGGGAAGDGAARLPGRARRRCSRSCRWCWARSGPSAPSTTTAARSTRPPRCRSRSSTSWPRRCSPSRRRRRWRSPRAWPAACCTTCARPNPAHHDVPQRNVPSRQAQWFVLSRLDSATVSTPDGRGVTFRRRDPVLFRPMLARSARAAARDRQGVARPAPPLPRGPARAHQPRGVGAQDVRPQLTSRRPRGVYCAVPSSAVCHWTNGRSMVQRPPSRVSTRSSHGSGLDSDSNSGTDHPNARRANSRIASRASRPAARRRRPGPGAAR